MAEVLELVDTFAYRGFTVNLYKTSTSLEGYDWYEAVSTKKSIVITDPTSHLAREAAVLSAKEAIVFYINYHNKRRRNALNRKRMKQWRYG